MTDEFSLYVAVDADVQTAAEITDVIYIYLYSHQEMQINRQKGQQELTKPKHNDMQRRIASAYNTLQRNLEIKWSYGTFYLNTLYACMTWIFDLLSQKLGHVTWTRS